MFPFGRDGEPATLRYGAQFVPSHPGCEICMRVFFRLLLIALLLCCSATFAAERVVVRRGCTPEELTKLPLSVQDHATWGKGEIRGETEARVTGYGCGGVTITDFVASAETAGGARVKVMFTYVVANESASEKDIGLLFTITYGEREVKHTVHMTLHAGETSERHDLAFLIPEMEMRLGAPVLGVAMHAERPLKTKD
jgi:hypothetical protein